jgi:hypothetical protein
MAVGISAALISVNADSGDSSSDYITNDPTLTIAFSTNATTTGTVGIWLTGGTFGTGTLVGQVAITTTGSDTHSFDLTTSSVVNAQSLADGNYTITLTNGTSTIGAMVAQHALTVDTTAPDLAIDLITGDNYIRLDEIWSGIGGFEITGTSTGAVGQTVSVGIYDNVFEALIYPYTTTVQGDGTWSVLVPTLDGVFLGDGDTFIVKADVSDVAGNPAIQQWGSFTVDETPPDISIDTIAGNDIVDATEANAGFTISGTSSGADGQTVNLILFDETDLVYVTKTYSATVQTGGAWSVSVSATDVATYLPTNHTFEVEADVTDAAGNQGQDLRDLYVDDNQPQLFLSPLVTDGATASEAQDAIFGVVQVLAQDGAPVQVTFTNGAHVVTKNFTSDGGYDAVPLTAADVAALTDGTISVSATQTVAGVASAPALASFVLDTGVPTAPIVTLAAGVSPGGATLAEATQAGGILTVQAEAGTTITVMFNNGGSPTVTKTLTATGSAQAVVLDMGDLSDLGYDGNYSAGAYAKDAAGNQSPFSIVFFTVDTQPPPPGGLIVAYSDQLVDSSEVTNVSFQVSGLQPGDSAVATFSDGTPAHDKTVNIPSNGNYFVNLTGLDRNVRSTLTITDSAGNSSTASGYPSTIIVDTDSALSLTIAEYNSIAKPEWQGNPAYSTVTVKDSPANFAALTGADIADMAVQGVDYLASSSGSFVLTVEQYENLGSLTITGTVKIVDTAAHIEGMTTGALALLAGKNIKILQYSDVPLTLTVAQYNNLGGVLLPTDHSTTLEDDGATISALSPAGLYANGVSRLASTDPVTLLAAQAIALGRVTVDAPSVTLADTAAHITGLSNKQLGALAASGFDAVDANDVNLTLTAAQFRALGTVALTDSDNVTIKDSWANISSLDLSTLATKHVDAINITGGSFAITAAQATALTSVAFTGSAVGTLVGPGSTIDGLADLLFLPSENITRIDASDDQLHLSVWRYQHLGAVQLTAGDTVTLRDTGDEIAALDASALSGLAAGRIDKVNVNSGHALTLWLDQFNALGTVVLDPSVVLTVKGDVGFALANDLFSFTRQPFSVADKINGYDGTDTLSLTGDYGTLAFNADTISSIEKLKLNGGGHSYDIVENNGNRSSGQTLSVVAAGFTAADSLSFDGSAETDAKFNFTGGAAGTSTFTGGTKADTFNAGAGADAIRYTSAAQSNSTAYDMVNGFDATKDSFVWSQVITFDGTVGGVLKTTAFEQNLTDAFSTVGADHAAILQATSGNMQGQMFLLINDASAGYAPGDLIVRLTNTDPLTFSDANFKTS